MALWFARKSVIENPGFIGSRHVPLEVGGALTRDKYSRSLDTFDSISQNLRGFFVGRFDVRYWSDDELRQGRNFRIIELNGAASEPTHVYDSRNSLWSAYRTLFHQWRIIYTIGAANRRLGFRPPSPYAVWRDWREFATQACESPLAD